jgi:hypothetical protein
LILPILFLTSTTQAAFHPDDFGWANRHTWQSWRNRYKSCQQIFDFTIEELAKTSVLEIPKNFFERSRLVEKGCKTHRPRTARDLAREIESEEEHRPPRTSNLRPTKRQQHQTSHIIVVDTEDQETGEAEPQEHDQEQDQDQDQDFLPEVESPTEENASSPE